MGKKKIDSAMKKILERGDKIFVPYIMAGDGGLSALPEQIGFLEECGATVIELGIPFSDPVADGPTIQAAGIRALEKGTTLRGVLRKLEEGKADRSIPIVLMGYFNLIYSFGIEEFAEACDASGVDGLIIPDLPLEEEEMVLPALEKYGIALIRLASPITPEARLEKIAERTEGFLYAVTVKGTTGARNEYDGTVSGYLSRLQELSAAPVLAGFGVSTPEQVRELGANCDGVIVGSKIVELLAAGERGPIRELIGAAKTAAIAEG